MTWVEFFESHFRALYLLAAGAVFWIPLAWSAGAASRAKARRVDVKVGRDEP